MGDDGALVPILYAMVVDEDLEVSVKTLFKRKAVMIPSPMEEDANVDRRWLPHTGSWEGKLFNICCLV
jgi:hypothetical protein